VNFLDSWLIICYYFKTSYNHNIKIIVEMNIPPSISNFQSLSFLQFNSYYLIGDYFLMIENDQISYLKINKIGRKIPSFIYTFPSISSLTHLGFHKCNISTPLDPQLTNLREMRELMLGDNPIEGFGLIELITLIS